MAYVVKRERASGAIYAVRHRDSLTGEWRQVVVGPDAAEADRVRARLEAEADPRDAAEDARSTARI